MYFSLNWLQRFFSSPLNEAAVEEKLTEAGLEVDSTTPITPSFEGVIVAKVLETSPHPDADKLCVAKVFDGQQELQIVCGASNCRAGLITALAPVGSTLTDAKGKKHKLKVGKLRGVDSFGMLLSAEELNLEAESTGIIELDDSWTAGELLAPHFQDTLFEISFTPNLGHAMSHLGIAREVACHLNLNYEKPKLKELKQAPKTEYTIDIHQAKSCAKYGCVLIKNVEVKPSPLWLQLLLRSCNLNPINNIVDVTNYILYHLGQPMHAFDASKVEGQSISIGYPNSNASLTTLDGIERKLTDEMLIILDQSKPIAIAGVMGGTNTQVELETTDILLEAAHFDAKSIRKTSKKLGLYTDASKHFERGVDYEMIETALSMATDLICMLCPNAKPHAPKISISLAPQQKLISLRLKQVNRILGTELNLSQVTQLLEKLEFKVKPHKQDSLEVTIPSYRNDVNLEIDLIEEIGRAYGLKKLMSKRSKFAASDSPDDLMYQAQQKIHGFLLEEGLQEVITCDLVSPEQNQMQAPMKTPIATLNYMSQEQSQLRTSLLANHLQVLKHNQDRQQSSVHIFEMGCVYELNEEIFKETEVISLSLMGDSAPFHWQQKENKLCFFHVKGILENLFSKMHLDKMTFKPSGDERFHPGVQAQLSLDGECIGIVGELHPKMMRAAGIKQSVFHCEMIMGKLVSSLLKPTSMAPISPYPASERDWTFTCVDHLHIGDMIEAIHSIPSRLLKEVSLRDIYRSEKIGTENKNITLRFVYRNDKKTVSFEAVEVEHARITGEVFEKMKQLMVQPS